MRRVVLSVLILAVVVPAVAFARVGYLCTMDGEVRSAACCPHKPKREAPPETVMSGAACCRITAVAPTTAPVAEPPRPSVQVPPALVAIVAEPVLAPPRRSGPSVTPRSLAPPDPDRSLFARHCALLL